MKYLKQRVPLTFDTSGQPLFINREFGDDIEALLAQVNSTTVSIAHLESTVADMHAALLLLTARIKKLESGYQA